MKPEILKNIDLGSINLNASQTEFYKKINEHIIDLYKGMPVCTHTDATLFMHQYSRINLGDSIDIFRYFYPPSWTIIYWMIHNYLPDITDIDKEHIIKAHTMAMYLHSIDDHLNDGEIPVNPVTLLLRSEIWRSMLDNMRKIAFDLPQGNEIINTNINYFYRSNYYSLPPATIDDYCTLFREQMATWSITPILLGLKACLHDNAISEIRTAYESFGIAWRLLDDILDIEHDYAEKKHTAVYLSLPKPYRYFWDNHSKRIITIIEYIIDNNILMTLFTKILHNLQTASLLVQKNNLNGLANEFLLLAGPLETLIA